MAFSVQAMQKLIPVGPVSLHGALRPRAWCALSEEGMAKLPIRAQSKLNGHAVVGTHQLVVETAEK